MEIICLLPTRNRPHFVARSVKSIIRHDSVRVIVLDASTPKAAERLKMGLLVNHEAQERVEVRFFDPGTSVTARLDFALASSSEPFVYLASDDDVTLGGFAAAREFMLHDPGVVACYGPTLRFSLSEGFTPYGTVRDIQLQRPVPQIPWQDDSSVWSRLHETSRGPLSSHGWYAIHRREALEQVVQTVRATGQADQIMEFALCVLQPILGRVHCVGEPFLARQNQDSMRTSQAVSHDEYVNVRQPLLEMATELLVRRYAVNAQQAASSVNEMIRRDRLFAAQRSVSKTATGKALKRVLSGISPALVERLANARSRRAGVSPHSDERLLRPSESEIESAVKLVMRYVSGT